MKCRICILAEAIDVQTGTCDHCFKLLHGLLREDDILIQKAKERRALMAASVPDEMSMLWLRTNHPALGAAMQAENLSFRARTEAELKAIALWKIAIADAILKELQHV